MPDSQKPDRDELSLSVIAQQLENLKHPTWIDKRLQIRGKRVKLSDLAVAIHQTFGLDRWEEGGYVEDVDFCGRNAMLATVSFIHFVNTSFKECNLLAMTFENCAFQNCSFESAQLRRVKFVSCTFAESRFQGALMHDVDFSAATEFPSKVLAGCDLTGAKLPEAVNEFSGLTFVSDVSKHSQRIFTILLLVCAYCWIVISTVSDVELLTSTKQLSLPVLQLGLSSQGFFFIGPFLILCMYVYLQLYLQRMWANLAELPAIFSDGRTLDDRADSWLLVSFVRRRFPYIKATAPPYWTLSYIVPILLTWFVAPATIMWFWLRFLSAQSWAITIFQILCFCVAGLVGVKSYRSACSLLDELGQMREVQVQSKRGKSRSLLHHLSPSDIGRSAVKIVTALKHMTLKTWIVVIFTCAMITAAIGVFEGTRESAIPRAIRAMSIIDYDVFPSFRDAIVSQQVMEKSPFTNERVPPEDVIGARLSQRRARNLDCSGAFLVSADFRNSDLKGANFAGADLRSAHFEGANLSGADFTSAIVVDAVFDGATMDNVNLQHVDGNYTFSLRNVPDLRGAKIGDIFGSPVTWDGSDFSGADLSSIGYMVRSTWEALRRDSTTIPPKNLI